MDWEEFEDLPDDDAHTELGLASAPRWGHWRITIARDGTCALVNIEHGEAEFPLGSMQTVDDLVAYAEHFRRKEWCVERDCKNMYRALQVALALTRDPVDVIREL